MPDIVITPNRGTTNNPKIDFTGTSAGTIKLEVLADGSIAWNGANGSLFSIADSLSGSLMSVNDISGLPAFEVFSDNRVVVGQFGANLLLGKTTSSSNGRLQLANHTTVAGGIGIGTDINLYRSAAGSLSIASSANPTQLKVSTTTAGGYSQIYLSNPTRDFILTNNAGDSLLSFNYSGANRLQFDTSNQWFNSGNVGIGTSSPAYKLEVIGDAKFGSGACNLYMVGAQTWRWIAGTSGYGVGNGFGLYHDTGGAYRLAVDTNGNVGIGTTSPASKLHVAGAGNSAGGNILMGSQADGTIKWSYLCGTHYNGTTEAKGVALIGCYATSTDNLVTLGGSIYESNPATAIAFYTHTANTHTTGGSEKMRIISNGNVGISTTSPSTKLHVYNGSIGITGASTGSSSITSSLDALIIGPYPQRNPTIGSYFPGLAFNHLFNYSGTTYDASAHGWIGLRLTSIAGAELSALVFATKPTTGTADRPIERMAITPDGNVGIGTTTPSQKLHVYGSADAAGILVGTSSGRARVTIDSATSALSSYLELNSGGNQIAFLDGNYGNDWLRIATNKSTAYISFETGNQSEKMRITANGSVGIGTTSPGYKLQVQGTAYVDSTLFVNGATTIEDTLTVKTQSGSHNVAIIDYSGVAGGRIKVLVDGVVRSQIGTYSGDNTFFNAGYGGNVGIGTSTPSYLLHAVGDIYANGGWFRVSGNQGYYFETHGGGWYMTDSTWLRAYNDKAIITNNEIRATIFKDANDTAYYADPASTSVLSKLSVGNAPYVASIQAGALELGRTDTNYQYTSGWTGTMQGGILANCADNWEFVIHDSGHRLASAFEFRGSGTNVIRLGRDLGWGVTPIETPGNLTVIGNAYAPVFYDYNDTNFRLDPASTTTSLQIAGAIEQGNNFAHPNVEWAQSGSATGMVIIKFPGNTGNYGMIHAVVDIYEYSSNSACTVTVAGHNWNGAWYNISSEVIGYTDKQVRVGVKDSQYCIVIGTSGSSWSYGQVRLRKIQNGSYYNDQMDLGGTYSASITTTESFSNISGDLRNLRTPNNISVGGGIYGQIFYDSNDTNYYVDPANGGFVLRGGTSNRVTFSTTDSGIFVANAEGGGTTVRLGAAWGCPGIYNNTSLTLGAESNIEFRIASAQKGYIDSSSNLIALGSMRSPIFYDYDNTGYYVDPNSTSVLWRPSAATQQRWGISWRAVDAGAQRTGQSSDPDYWTTTIGWGTGYGTWADYWKYGAGFFECWGNSTDHPQGSGYVHAQGLQSGLHYANSNGTTAYGWQMVGAADAGSRWWLRGKWGGTTNPWYEIALFNRNVGGILYADLLYDAGNTGYYVDPASTSVLNNTQINYNQGNFECASNNNSSTSYSVAAIELRETSFGSTSGYLAPRLGFHWGGVVASQIGIESNGRIKIIDNPGTSYEAFIAAIVYGDASVRGPVFYDSNDTGYYFDGSSTADNCVKIAGGIHVSNANVSGNGIRLADDGDIVDNNDGYCSMRFSYGVRIHSGNRTNTAKIDLKNDGSIVAAGNITAYGSPSDIRLKENLVKIENALQKVTSINGYHYNYIGKTDKLIGVIAQEVEPVLPEVVYEFSEVGSDPNTSKTKAVRYEHLTAVLIEAIKEQQKQIEQLSNELKSLKNKL